MRNKQLKWVIVWSACMVSHIGWAASDRKVAVTGECTRLATPDRAEITVVASFRNTDIKKAIRDATQAYDKTRNEVSTLNLAHLDLQTSEYVVREVVEWEKDRQVSKGYEARMGLKVSTSNVAQMGQVIAVAAEQGLKEVGQLRMFLSEEKLNAEKRACLKTAAEHAHAKAKELASSLSAKVGKVVSIREEEARLEPVRPMMAMMMADSNENARAAPAPQVEGGKQQVITRVEAVFDLE